MLGIAYSLKSAIVQSETLYTFFCSDKGKKKRERVVREERYPPHRAVIISLRRRYEWYRGVVVKNPPTRNRKDEDCSHEALAAAGVMILAELLEMMELDNEARIEVAGELKLLMRQEESALRHTDIVLTMLCDALRKVLNVSRVDKLSDASFRKPKRKENRIIEIV